MIKKERIKGFVAGIALATVLMSTSVFAQTYKKQLTAVYNDIKIVIDGVRITPKDGDGKKVDPFVVQGTTYLPVRAVAEALGKPVKWDSKSNSVIIGTEKTASGNIGITELIKSRPNYYGEKNKAFVGDIDSFKVLQKTYSGENTIFGKSYYPWSFYYGDHLKLLLNSDFKKLTGKIAIPDDGKEGIIIIKVNGEEVLRTKVERGGEVVPIELDLLGANELEIQNNYVNFFNVELEPINK